jgi:hypothetical protein
MKANGFLDRTRVDLARLNEATAAPQPAVL